MTSVITPKLRPTFWTSTRWGTGGETWLCNDRIRRFWGLGRVDCIRMEVSTTRLGKESIGFWFCAKHRLVFWGQTQRCNGYIYWGFAGWLLKRFPITTEPTKLYVRLWLLTGRDAGGE